MSDLFDYNDPESWRAAWSAVLACSDSRAPRLRARRAVRVDPLPHRAIKDLQVVTAEFLLPRGMGPNTIAHNPQVEGRLADQIGVATVSVLPHPTSTGVRVLFLLPPAAEAA